MDAGWELGIRTFDTADAYGGGRSESWIGEWLAANGSACAKRAHVETKTFNPMAEGADHGLGARTDRAAARVEPAAARPRARRSLPRPRVRPRHAARGDAPAFDALVRAGKVGRGRRVQLLGRSSSRRRSRSPSSRASSATSGSRTPSPSSSGPTRRPSFRSATSTGSATRRSGRSPAAGSRSLPARQAYPERLADDAATGRLPQVRERRSSTRSSRSSERRSGEASRWPVSRSRGSSGCPR